MVKRMRTTIEEERFSWKGEQKKRRRANRRTKEGKGIKITKEEERRSRR